MLLELHFVAHGLLRSPARPQKKTRGPNASRSTGSFAGASRNAFVPRLLNWWQDDACFVHGMQWPCDDFCLSVANDGPSTDPAPATPCREGVPTDVATGLSLCERAYQAVPIRRSGTAPGGIQTPGFTPSQAPLWGYCNAPCTFIEHAEFVADDFRTPFSPLKGAIPAAPPVRGARLA